MCYHSFVLQHVAISVLVNFTDAGTDFVDHESEIKKLEHQLSDYRNIIGQQEEMLLQVVTCTSTRLAKG